MKTIIKINLKVVKILTLIFCLFFLLLIIFSIFSMCTQSINWNMKHGLTLKMFLEMGSINNTQMKEVDWIYIMSNIIVR